MRLRKAVSRLGLVRPTLVQSKCLPLAISSGRDLLVRARTGSGKTLAYCLPLLQKILKNTQKEEIVKAVILVPTRELCTQVHKTLQGLVYYASELVQTAVLSGGRMSKEDLARQEAMLRDCPNVVVATPGGLLVHIRNNRLNLKQVETLVVDEADLVLSFGYTNDIAEIMKSLPKICQGFLMSATLSPELNSLKNVVLHSPAILKLEEEMEDPVKKKGQLRQFYLTLPHKDKNLVLYVFLKLGLLKGKGLFFCNSTDGGYRLKLFLEQFSIRSAVLNAELPLRSRLNIIEQFNVGNFDYLIATDDSADMGASTTKKDDDEDEQDGKPKRKRHKDSEYGVSRGLDFRNVSFVVNVDFPTSPESYTHRVGRTARGGAKGVALSLVELESPEQSNVLVQVQEEQPLIGGTDTDDALHASKQEDASLSTKQTQPCPLDFDLRDIEGFRYRVEDVSRAVTRMAVRETRAAELRAEILNSERLQSHFEENPNDLQLLQHDRVSSASRVQEHLKHVPKYMLPRGMQVADLNKRRKRKRISVRGRDGARRTDNDPLQSYSGEKGDLEGTVDEEESGGFEEFFEEGGDAGAPKAVKAEAKVFSNTRDGAGKSTAGRNAWKEKHNRGKFSNKKRKSEPKRRTVGV